MNPATMAEAKKEAENDGTAYVLTLWGPLPLCEFGTGPIFGDRAVWAYLPRLRPGSSAWNYRGQIVDVVALEAGRPAAGFTCFRRRPR